MAKVIYTSDAIITYTGSDTVTINWTGQAQKEARALVSDSVAPLTIAHDVTYDASQIKRVSSLGNSQTVTIDTVEPTPAQASATEEFYRRRAREASFVRRYYTNDRMVAYRQMCVFVKRDKLDKSLAGLVCYTIKGTVFVIVSDCQVIGARNLGQNVSVSETLAREIIGAPAECHVYLQDVAEVLKEHTRRMDDSRRKYGYKRDVPKARKVGTYKQKARGRIDNDKVFESLPNVTYTPAWLPDPPTKDKDK